LSFPRLGHERRKPDTADLSHTILALADLEDAKPNGANLNLFFPGDAQLSFADLSCRPAATYLSNLILGTGTRAQSDKAPGIPLTMSHKHL
jgi:uncharacterized protein YjbI with pentapeptide repeats